MKNNKVVQNDVIVTKDPSWSLHSEASKGLTKPSDVIVTLLTHHTVTLMVSSHWSLQIKITRESQGAFIVPR